MKNKETGWEIWYGDLQAGCHMLAAHQRLRGSHSSALAEALEFLWSPLAEDLNKEWIYYSSGFSTVLSWLYSEAVPLQIGIQISRSIKDFSVVKLSHAFWWRCLACSFWDIRIVLPRRTNSASNCSISFFTLFSGSSNPTLISPLWETRTLLRVQDMQF